MVKITNKNSKKLIIFAMDKVEKIIILKISFDA